MPGANCWRCGLEAAGVSPRAGRRSVCVPSAFYIKGAGCSLERLVWYHGAGTASTISRCLRCFLATIVRLSRSFHDDELLKSKGALSLVSSSFVCFKL